MTWDFLTNDTTKKTAHFFLVAFRMVSLPSWNYMLLVKLLITLGLFASTIICCFLPWVIHAKVSRRSTLIMSLLTCAACGVILGALLFHLIPEFIPERRIYYYMEKPQDMNDPP